MKKNKIYRVLAIAGSDCSGGAGIQADLKTLTAFGVYGMSVITALTAQNTLGVHKIENITFDFIEKQLDACISDIGVDAIKIGMVHKSEIFKIITKICKRYKLINNKKIKIVLDPVMFAKGGHRLLELEAIEALKKFIKDVNPILTPNIPEAELLSEQKILNLKQMKIACKKIHKMQPEAIILKGGHLTTRKLVDIVFSENKFFEFHSKKINTKNTHGTGCTLSSAIAANLAKSKSIVEAMEIAHQYVLKAVKVAPNFGKGHGPINHYHNIKSYS
tara:strand:- start:329 stop:1153 length:825 start_codon:yes stop_codon:yes gene_type:complete